MTIERKRLISYKSILNELVFTHFFGVFSFFSFLFFFHFFLKKKKRRKLTDIQADYMLISTFETQQLSSGLRPQVFNHTSSSSQKIATNKANCRRGNWEQNPLLKVQMRFILWAGGPWTSDDVEKLVGFMLILSDLETLLVGEARGSKSSLEQVDYQQLYQIHPILPL